MHVIKQKIAGTIKSLDPPCTGKPSGNSKHPSTCDNCHMQEHYLVDLFNKRSDAKLKNTAGASRIGERGFGMTMRRRLKSNSILTVMKTRMHQEQSLH